MMFMSASPRLRLLAGFVALVGVASILARI
jgi:hypothetical protein